MNKEEYYKISNEKKLPLRCPILNYCSRRALTIYINSDYEKYNSDSSYLDSLKRDGTIPKDFEKKKIDIQGESPLKIGGNSSSYYNHMCPEVNLFDDLNSLFPGKACVESDYDKYRNENKSRVIKCQHFSECPEFNKYIFDGNQKSTSSNKKIRIAIPQKTKAILQKEIKSTCPFCSNEDVEHFQIHHIDENPQNNSLENLLMLCPICHSKITKGYIEFEKVKSKKVEISIK